MSDGRRPPPSRPRWGVRTLWFLALAMASLLTSNVLRYYEIRLQLLPFLGIVAGLVGAGYCSVRGLRAAQGRGWRTR